MNALLNLRFVVSVTTRRLLAILARKRSHRTVTRAAELGAILAVAELLVTLAAMQPRVQAEVREPWHAESTGVLPAGGAETRADRQVFLLTYRQADETDGVVRGNAFHHCLPGMPAEAKAVPADLSAQVLYFLLPIGGRKVPAVLDLSPSPRLFVDIAGTGDLSAARPLPAKPWGSLHQFGPAPIPVHGQAGRIARVRFLSSLNKDIAVAPAGYMAGEVKLTRQPYRVALIDHSLCGI